jgi:hypothetical protein
VSTEFNVLRACLDWIAMACGLAMTLISRHCEERSDEAIQLKKTPANSFCKLSIDAAGAKS